MTKNNPLPDPSSLAVEIGLMRGIVRDLYASFDKAMQQLAQEWHLNDPDDTGASPLEAHV